ncbi:MAG: hypothetical protein H6642_12015 [Caldilineaceae bacterium]|nr:hypothetical protein [Caldilineaceae bacterium]MCB9139063.1 hypothetical protein [Caldilineaceae bacterium]
MDCPNCNTWNPDDKDVCWRCQEPLPKPEEKKKRRSLSLFGMPIWLWIALAVFIAVTVLGPYLLRPAGLP